MMMGVQSTGASVTRDISVTHALLTMKQPHHKPSPWLKRRSSFVSYFLTSAFVVLTAAIAEALPNGTWFSKPQIMFHLSNATLSPVMERVRTQRFRVVFLDFRNVSDLDQQKVVQTVRQSNLVPVAWIQSPQFRALSVQQLADEGRHTDGIQVDDHFFANYSRSAFYALRSQYRKPIYCSIQPFQAALVPPSGCNQIDVQCYTPISVKKCAELADRLRAITSLSTQNTLGYRELIGKRAYNVFLWPHSDEFVQKAPTQNLEVTSLSNSNELLRVNDFR